MPKIILIEDDKQIALSIQHMLREYGYDVLHAADGEAGVKLVQEQPPDLIVLDILLPKLDGWAVCRLVRQTSVVPILMLSSLNEEVDRILGLELGADDYLTKPFSTRELLAHIRAILRRVEFSAQSNRPSQMLTVDDIAVDINRRQVTKGGQVITLRHKAFELLSLLVSRAGQVVSRGDIFDEVWGTDWIGDTRTLEVHIRWLRKALEIDPSQPHYIQTVRGVGYRFMASETP